MPQLGKQHDPQQHEGQQKPERAQGEGRHFRQGQVGQIIRAAPETGDQHQQQIGFSLRRHGVDPPIIIVKGKAGASAFPSILYYSRFGRKGDVGFCRPQAGQGARAETNARVKRFSA